MTKEDIVRLIEEAAEETGFMLYEYSVDLRNLRTKITVRIDSFEAIKHSDCETFSRHLSGKLHGVQDYSLEVSSPGINRKLRSWQEFSRFTGAPAKVVFDDASGRRRTTKGDILRADDNAVAIAVAEGKKEEHEIEIPLVRIVRANLDY